MIQDDKYTPLEPKLFIFLNLKNGGILLKNKYKPFLDTLL